MKKTIFVIIASFQIDDLQRLQWKRPTFFLETYIPHGARKTIPCTLLIFWKYTFLLIQINELAISFRSCAFLRIDFNNVLQSILKNQSSAWDNFLSSTWYITCRQKFPSFSPLSLEKCDFCNSCIVLNWWFSAFAVKMTSIFSDNLHAT